MNTHTATTALTKAQFLCLQFLNDKMEATANRIGHVVVGKVPGGGSNYISVGTGVAVSLRRKGFVTHIRDLCAWRITPEGRAELAKATGSQSGTAGNASAMKELPGSPSDEN